MSEKIKVQVGLPPKCKCNGQNIHVHLSAWDIMDYDKYIEMLGDGFFELHGDFLTKKTTYSIGCKVKKTKE